MIASVRAQRFETDVERKLAVIHRSAWAFAEVSRRTSEHSWPGRVVAHHRRWSAVECYCLENRSGQITLSRGKKMDADQ